MRSSKLPILAVLAAFAGATLASPAEARRNRREGLNFGTSIRLLDAGERTTAGEGADKSTNVKSSSQAMAPYLGYAWESLNVGLTVLAENQSSEIVEHAADGQSTTTRQTDRASRGGSVFFRFLFGRVFFFEAAGGIYQEHLKVATERKDALGEGGAFTGEEDRYEVKGIGPGYHLGGGLELPMGDNFFFTSTYQFRMVTLRDYNGGASLGKKRSTSQKREALFGIGYYHK